MRYAAKLKQHPSHPTYSAVFLSSFLVTFREARRRRFEPFYVRMLRLFDESIIDLRGVGRVSHLSVSPWQLIQPSVDTSLSETKKGELPVAVPFAGDTAVIRTAAIVGFSVVSESL